MFSSIHSATLTGIQGSRIAVEVHIGAGLPGFTIVGLPDEACREARDRVRAALLSSGCEWPNRKITVNLAPSSQRKGGVGLDLALAVGILTAMGELPAEEVAHHAFVAELGLDGSLRPVPGVAPLVSALVDHCVVVAPASCREARVVNPRQVLTADNLMQLVACLRGQRPWRAEPESPRGVPEVPLLDMRDVRGQPVARLAAEVAAAGGHNVLFVGGPGGGKTMLAQRIPGLLPPLEGRDAVMATMVHSAAGVALPEGGLVTRPPFRAPHHSASTIAMVGGGTGAMRPGEVSLAHAGVLFLDEVGEFAPSVLDALRQPLESGEVHIARANASAALPARFLLVGATNPCPCGGGGPGSCVCSDTSRAKYLRRLSGPLLDRFDLRITVAATDPTALLDVDEGESSASIRDRVMRVREVSLVRAGKVNALLGPGELDETAPLAPSARDVLRGELETARLTGRGYHRIRRVARTLADLAGNEGPISEEFVRSALLMRTALGVRNVSA
jgi:magnesium chelatase family protein